MTLIAVTEDMIRVDAVVLAGTFEITPGKLKGRMGGSGVTSRAERGEGGSEGKICMTFLSRDRRGQIAAEESGKVLTCHPVQIYMSAASRNASFKTLLGEVGAKSLPASYSIVIQRRSAIGQYPIIKDVRRWAAILHQRLR